MNLRDVRLSPLGDKLAEAAEKAEKERLALEAADEKKKKIIKKAANKK